MMLFLPTEEFGIFSMKDCKLNITGKVVQQFIFVHSQNHQFHLRNLKKNVSTLAKTYIYIQYIKEDMQNIRSVVSPCHIKV